MGKEKIAIEMKILSKDPQQKGVGIYTLRIANFTDVASSMIEQKEYERTVKLQSGTTAYYKNGQIFWKEASLEYHIQYLPLPDGKDTDKLESVIDMANQME
ncbi:hypothetical protein MUG87_01305 [Ectobacillus sp. JY-23]|uniref:hypothetical protein n=1 Tax=Ectobacillus sp. JY-23 TaxID=2933872 RepID=UPI001FF66999|nr:hypothetical protein [Ectobacillus sp. JY-23]UOY92812.1 hypothetical protein MUG87_01305 [Ectobacillus sp. JY-23]